MQASMHHHSSSRDSNRASHTACLQGQQHCFSHPGTPPMGEHHHQLHCQLFTMEVGALPQAMPQTTCRQLSQLAGDYTCLGKQDQCWKPHHTLAPEQCSAQRGTILPPASPAPPASRAHSSASPVARAAGMGKCCTCKEMQPQGWRAAAGPVLLHHSSTACSLGCTGRASSQGSM